MMDIYRTTPKESGSITIRGHDVTFLKCQEHSMGETKYFWRADCGGETIATGCTTKAECIKEARGYLRQKASENAGNALGREHLIAFAKAAIEELGLSSNDVKRYLQGGKRKCFDCGCLHLYIDRFCPECGVLAREGEETQ